MSASEYVEGSDELPARLVGPWAQEKLHYVSRYFDIFNEGMKNHWPTRYYVDIFSGPGLCRIRDGDEIAGSPIRAVQLPRAQFSHFFFNDLDAVAIDALETRLLRQHPAVDGWRTYNTDCNDLPARLLPDLPDGGLGLAFIDCLTWEMSFESIASLAANRRLDLIVTFHNGSMKRAAEFEPEALARFFGSNDWKDKYQEERGDISPRSTRALIDFYEAQLSKLGYAHVDDHVRITNTRGTPLYHLVFASKHPRGADFFKKISQKNTWGQARMDL